MDTYQYLFPFEKVERGSNIIIYGAGVMGQEYVKQILLTNYCRIIGMVDRNYEKYGDMRVPVYAPERIHELDFDTVVIALQKAHAYNEIVRILKTEGVDEGRVVCTFIRNTDGLNVIGNNESDDGDRAYELTKRAIAVSLTGGIGDKVIQKRFLMELARLMPDARMDLFVVDGEDFLTMLYADVPSFHRAIPNLGIRYERSIEKYAIALFVEGTGYIRVDHFEEAEFDDIDFIEKIKSLKKYCDRENADMRTPMFVLNARRLYEGLNCYTAFGCGGIFDIDDIKVSIPLSRQSHERFLKSRLKQETYITLNYGNGQSSNGRLVSKAWPLTYFHELAAMVGREMPGIRIVQIGDIYADRIDGIDEYILGESIEYAAQVLKHSLLHVDIDGGLVHIASQLGTKCLVLFGPTSADYYGYEENINLTSELCKGCYGLYSNSYLCARHMDRPECMYSLKPEIVMSYIREFMKENAVNIV